VIFSGDKTVRIFSNGTFQELSYSPLGGFKYGLNHVTFDNTGAVLSVVGTDGRAHLYTLSDQAAKVELLLLFL